MCADTTIGGRGREGGARNAGRGPKQPGVGPSEVDPLAETLYSPEPPPAEPVNPLALTEELPRVEEPVSPFAETMPAPPEGKKPPFATADTLEVKAVKARPPAAARRARGAEAGGTRVITAPRFDEKFGLGEEVRWQGPSTPSEEGVDPFAPTIGVTAVEAVKPVGQPPRPAREEEEKTGIWQRPVGGEETTVWKPGEEAREGVETRLWTPEPGAGVSAPPAEELEGEVASPKRVAVELLPVGARIIIVTESGSRYVFQKIAGSGGNGGALLEVKESPRGRMSIGERVEVDPNAPFVQVGQRFAFFIGDKLSSTSAVMSVETR